MSEDELFVMIVSAGVIFTAFPALTMARLSPLLRRNNPGLGLAKLAPLAGLAWIWFVLLHFADPSVTGIYIYFYLLFGLAAMLLFGGMGLRLFGLNWRVDIGERRNWAAAVFCVSFMLATGMIFGGSIWGEADPHSEWEGGWWIPAGFFLMGWLVMVGMLALYCWRVPGGFRTAILSDRDPKAAYAAASFVFSTAIMMTEAVAGDFLGWGEGVFMVILAGGMLLAHELLRTPVHVVHVKSNRNAWLSSVIYLALAGLRLLASRIWQ